MRNSIAEILNDLEVIVDSPLPETSCFARKYFQNSLSSEMKGFLCK